MCWIAKCWKTEHIRLLQVNAGLQKCTVYAQQRYKHSRTLIKRTSIQVLGLTNDVLHPRNSKRYGKLSQNNKTMLLQTYFAPLLALHYIKVLLQKTSLSINASNCDAFKAVSASYDKTTINSCLTLNKDDHLVKKMNAFQLPV